MQREPNGQVISARRLTPALASVLVVFGAACAEDNVDGAIVHVSWSIGGTTCEKSGVTDVVIGLYSAGVAVVETDAACAAGQTTIENVPPGTYVVQVKGIQASTGRASYVGQAPAITVPDGAAITAAPIEMSEAPGALDVHWRFESGELCRFVGASWVTLVVYDERSRKVADRAMDCDPSLPAETGPKDGAEFLAEAKGVVLDGMFAGDYTIFLRAYERSSEKTPLFFANATATVEPFILADVPMVLKTCVGAPAGECD